VVKNFCGMRIGFFTTKRIVEACGGTLHAESEPGKGSTFVLWLQFAE